VQAIRVLTAEMARISAHLMGLGAFGLDVGAWSVLVHSLNQREHLYKLFEELTGARFRDKLHPDRWRHPRRARGLAATRDRVL